MEAVKEILYTLLTSGAGAEIVLAGIAALFAWLIKKNFAEKYKLTKLIQFVESATTKVYQEYVSDIKKAREDGKLTKDEAGIARSKAINLIKEQAKGEGWDLVKDYSDDYIKAVIERVINKVKS